MKTQTQGFKTFDEAKAILGGRFIGIQAYVEKNKNLI